MTQDYAARILQKYGWEKYTDASGTIPYLYTYSCRGKGLGKEEQGIQKPIAPVAQKTTEGVFIFILHYTINAKPVFIRSAIRLHSLSHGGTLCMIT